MSSPKSTGKSAKTSTSREAANGDSPFRGETASAASSLAKHDTIAKTGGDGDGSKNFEKPSFQGASSQTSVEPKTSGTAMEKDPLEAVTTVTTDFSEAAKAATEAIKRQAGDLTANIGSELSRTAEQQKRQGAEAIQGFARAVNTAASELESQSPIVARYVHDAAQQIETLGSNLSNRNVNELMMAVTDLARRRPALFLGGAVAAGMVLARFLKSSARTQPNTGA